MFIASPHQDTGDILHCQGPSFAGIVPQSCKLVSLNERYLLFAANHLTSGSGSTVLNLFPGSDVRLRLKSAERAGGQITEQLFIFLMDGGGRGYLVVSLLQQVIFGSFNSVKSIFRVDNCDWKYFGCILFFEIDLNRDKTK